MDAYMIWLLAAGVLVGAELLTGTFYLLMVALGAAAAGLAALAGAGLAAQFACAALLSVAGSALLRRRGGGRQSGEKTNLAFDAGQSVEVVERRADGTLRVSYRGSHWDAELEAGSAAGPYVIREMRGNLLVLGERP